MRQHQKFWSALILFSPALNAPSLALITLWPWFVAIVHLPVNKFPNRLVPKVSNNIPRNPAFFSFVLRSFETCVLVNNLCRKLFSSLVSPTTFDETFKVTPVPFFVPNFNLWSYELDNFTFKVLYWVILYWYYIRTK